MHEDVVPCVSLVVWNQCVPCPPEEWFLLCSVCQSSEDVERNKHYKNSPALAIREITGCLWVLCGCFPKPFWKCNGNQSGCDIRLCLVGTFPVILIFPHRRTGACPVSVRGRAVGHAGVGCCARGRSSCVAFPQAPPRHTGNVCLHRQPLCRGMFQQVSDVICLFGTSAFGEGSALWGVASFITERGCPAERTYFLGAFSSQVLPFLL